jgi:hypothetical protein
MARNSDPNVNNNVEHNSNHNVNNIMDHTEAKSPESNPSKSASNSPDVPTTSSNIVSDWFIRKDTRLGEGNKTFQVSIAYSAASTCKPVVILDWDDTFFPSSLLRPNSGKIDDIDTKMVASSEFIAYEATALACLEKLVHVGAKVLIVTNADKGWVELCCERFAIKLGKRIRDLSIPIISARTLHEKKHPERMIYWKYLVFEQEVIHDGQFHMISVGDSICERAAVARLADTYKYTVMKNVKLKDKPTMKELQHQLYALSVYVSNIVSYPFCLDLQLNCT